MSKIIVTQGPPATGKTTWAKNFVKENHHWVIVCRDSIRQSLGEYWVPERENLVSKIEYETIKQSIEMGWNVVIDATNLNKKTIAKWEALADEMDCEIEYKEFWIPFYESVQRDLNPDRDHKVGYKVIYDFYSKYRPELLETDKYDYRYIKPLDNTKERAVLVDLDGTTAIHWGRTPFEYEKCDTDKPNIPLFRIIESLHNDGYTIIFISGRENIGDTKQKTVDWIKRWFKEDFKFFLREEGDHRPDQIIKEEIYHNKIESKYDVHAVYDDRDRVCKMWRELGLLCCQVYYGNF